MISKSDYQTVKGATVHSLPLASPSAYEASLGKAIQNLACRSTINPEAFDRFASLRKSLLEWLPDDTTRLPLSSFDGNWKHWNWDLYVDEPEIRIGLITMYKNRPIPIHDHPGANGVLLVLSGEVTINQYRLHQDTVANNLNLSELTLTNQVRLLENEFVCITPDDGNIHSLSTLSESCTLLDVLLTPYDEQRRTWYIPATDQVCAGQPFSAFRINRK